MEVIKKDNVNVATFAFRRVLLFSGGLSTSNDIGVSYEFMLIYMLTDSTAIAISRNKRQHGWKQKHIHQSEKTLGVFRNGSQ